MSPNLLDHRIHGRACRSVLSGRLSNCLHQSVAKGYLDELRSDMSSSLIQAIPTFGTC